MHRAITDVSGIKVGHSQDNDKGTGCTVILCPPGTVGGVDDRGTASSTRQLDSLHPLHLVSEVHAVFLSGGSAYGLDAAAGVMSFLEEKGIGFSIRDVVVPTVPTAIIFDLLFQDSSTRPTPEMARQACLNAADGPVQEGNMGVGCGATVGKIAGINQAMKGGVGTWSKSGPGGVVVGGLAVVNAFGDVIDPDTRKILAGARTSPENHQFINTAEFLQGGDEQVKPSFEHTTLGVIATNVRLNREQLNIVARMAHDSLAATVVPSHSSFDGDVIFALSAGIEECSVDVVGLLAVQVMAECIKRGVTESDGLGSVPSYRDVHS